MNKQAHNHLIALLQGMEENALSAEQARELTALLESSPEARQVYIDYQFQAMSLDLYAHASELSPQNIAQGNWPAWMDKQSSSTAEALAELARLHEEGLKQPIDLELHRKQQAQTMHAGHKHPLRLKTKLILTGSLAAAIALAGLTVLIVNLFSGPDQPIAEQLDDAIVVATLTDVRDAQWAERALARGSALHAGDTLTLTQGFAEITTNDGAIAILQAPATIELLDSPNAMRLHAGNLVGLCHTESSKGFVVKTRHAEIVDLGTEFAITAHADGIDTSVFIGKVEITTADGKVQPITTNQTARLAVTDDKLEMSIEDQPAKGFARRLPRDPLITAASINLTGFEIEVVSEGLYEDAKVYSDRDHELNGVDTSGLPSMLLGGDLVRMPGDARAEVDPTLGDRLRLDITFSQPADLYLILRKDYDAPDWLTRDYERTGMHVGLDLVSDVAYIGRSYERGVGPGDSIDLVQDVWKRKQPATGQVTAARAIERAMYCIIAVPVDESSR